MDATDLMIGDWVLDGTQYAQVTSITCDGNVETTKNEHSNIEVIEPIPLTDDILCKYFFNHGGYYSDTIKAPRDGEYYILYERKRLTIRLNSEIKYNVAIDCVHELQHALKLCGIEKEIEL